eukprot:CAMPEP_0113903132 /NCGR_PEP_ID=MMETSP0780_2-20120614/22307_1 /TAXON_ID=652834 /ORGANISM="Palpitomonas bilix" /LENGTH=774 /DNA_ID=CAMNT_0000896157 /DNA_START=161 /DNA_END=2482 /DNA_ORIENTATION=+ /assembly_acc=CAM_ASM_000599
MPRCNHYLFVVLVISLLCGGVNGAGLADGREGSFVYGTFSFSRNRTTVTFYLETAWRRDHAAFYIQLGRLPEVNDRVLLSGVSPAEEEEDGTIRISSSLSFDYGDGSSTKVMSGRVSYVDMADNLIGVSTVVKHTYSGEDQYVRPSLSGCCKISDLLDMPAAPVNITQRMRGFYLDGIVNMTDIEKEEDDSPSIRMMPIVTLSPLRDGTTGSFLFATDHPSFTTLGEIPIMDEYGVTFDGALHSDPPFDLTDMMYIPTVDEEGIVSLPLSYSMYVQSARKVVDFPMPDGYYGLSMNTSLQGNYVSAFVLLRILSNADSVSYPLMGVNQTASQQRPSVGASRLDPVICYQGFDCDITVYGSVNLTVENEDATFSVWLGTKGLPQASRYTVDDTLCDFPFEVGGISYDDCTSLGMSAAEDGRKREWCVDVTGAKRECVPITARGAIVRQESVLKLTTFSEAFKNTTTNETIINFYSVATATTYNGTFSYIPTKEQGYGYNVFCIILEFIPDHVSSQPYCAHVFVDVDPPPTIVAPLSNVTWQFKAGMASTYVVGSSDANLGDNVIIRIVDGLEGMFMGAELTVGASASTEFVWDVPLRFVGFNETICFQAEDDGSHQDSSVDYSDVYCVHAVVQSCMWTVQSRRGLDVMASLLGTNRVQLWSANPELSSPDDSSVKVGDMLTIGHMYTAKANDTFLAVALRYASSPSLLRSINYSIGKQGDLVVGDRICVLPYACREEIRGSKKYEVWPDLKAEGWKVGDGEVGGKEGLYWCLQTL